MAHRLAAVSELAATDDRREPELALADQRFGVDHKPWLAFGAQDVVGVQTWQATLGFLIRQGR